MEELGGDKIYTLDIPEKFRHLLNKLQKSNPELVIRLAKQTEKLVHSPFSGKPMRNVLRNYRRIHIDPFVLIYEVKDQKVGLVDFDHHDRIYKRYK